MLFEWFWMDTAAMVSVSIAFEEGMEFVVL